MTRRSCDGAGLLGAFRAAVLHLEAHIEEINGLNVFPVPDGDTGSNMAATVRKALAEAEAVAGEPAGRIAGAISFGALMGARGNSGVITSQILNGMARGIASKRRFNGLDLAHALTLGTETAYAAVKKPVEGTILTVIREAAAAARTAAERDDSIEHVLSVTVDAAERAVARTPTLLPILREAGVVDSGGQGLYRLLQGALLYLVGETVGRPAPGTVGRPRTSALVAHADDGYGYETMYLLTAAPGRSLDLDVIRTELEVIGQSVVVAGDGRAAKVHAHSPRPDAVIAYGLQQGILSLISVENLDEQARGLRDTSLGASTSASTSATVPVATTQVAPAAAMPATAPPATAPPATAPPVSGPSGPEPTSSAGHTTFAHGARDGARLPLAVIAVVAGEGLASILADFGVAAIVRGGQAANPSTGELLAAIDAVNADEFLILPNNPNVVLAARQVAELAGRPVHVVPTRNAAEGFAALLALDPGQGAAANVTHMTERGRELATLLVTTATRDAKVSGHKVRKGQAIVLDPDEGLVSVDGDVQKAILAAVATLPPGLELITLYYGDGADLAEAEHVAAEIDAARPGVDVEVHHGGQPHYRYLVSAE